MGSVTATLLEKGANGERLLPDEVRALLGLTLCPQDIHALGEAAFRNRTKRYGTDATFVENLFVNPSNICSGTCGFCHYRAREEDPHAYILSEESILEQIERLRPSEVHVVGGLNTIWHFDRLVGLLKEIRRRWSEVYIKSFTAVEIDHFARQKRTTPADVLRTLAAIPIQGLTGGGAEVFSARLRKQLCPEKMSPYGWLSVHREAHALGLRTNATLLYGIGETADEIAGHLLALRDAQDRSGGFSCFIPLPYQPSKNDPDESGPTALYNLAMIACARLILDNFDHVKAYWPMIGLETAAAGLYWGADDLDGTLGDERIAHAGKTATPRMLTRAKMRETITAGGFRPVLRDGAFNRYTGELE